MSDGYDRQEPNPKVVILAAAVLLTFVSVSGFGIRGYFLNVFDGEQHTKVAEAPTTELDKMRATTSAEMHSYGWVDEKASTMHMPIERAMDLEVERAHQKSEAPIEKKVSDKKSPEKKSDKKDATSK